MIPGDPDAILGRIAEERAKQLAIEDRAFVKRAAEQRDDYKSIPKAITQVKQHSHYFKSVAGLSHVDVYRVLELFDVTNPSIQHAIKKLLVAGGRGGGKDISKDIKEAIDSLGRWQAMARRRRDQGRAVSVERCARTILAAGPSGWDKGTVLLYGCALLGRAALADRGVRGHHVPLGQRQRARQGHSHPCHALGHAPRRRARRGAAHVGRALRPRVATYQAESVVHATGLSACA